MTHTSPWRTLARLSVCAWAFVCVGCKAQEATPFAVDAPLLITEIVANNEGVWVDEVGEADDFIELVNQTDAPLWLGAYSISDKASKAVPLPARVLAPREVILIWADASPHQGPAHLPFKLSSTGETLFLWGKGGQMVAKVPFPALAANLSFARRNETGQALAAFDVCRYPTPLAANGSCAPPVAPELPDDVAFAPFAWPANFPAPTSPLSLSELALRPTTAGEAFIEVVNTSASSVALQNFALRIDTTKPGQALPIFTEGAAVPMPAGVQVPPSGRAVIPVPAEALQALVQDPLFEGVVTLFANDAQIVDRTDFMQWPMGSALARPPGNGGEDFRLCQHTSPGQDNVDCAPLPSRAVGDRLRHLRTPGDFAALAEGGTALSQQAVKVIVDIARGNVVHLLSTRGWPLHYNFVRELMDKQERLNLCDATQNALFHAAWVEFSQKEYFLVEGRQYLLSTLVKHAGTPLQTLEFAVGDVISGPQMQQAFFATMASLPDPKSWSVRPQTPDQVQTSRAVEGQIPLVGPNTPFRGQTYQPLTAAVGFGVLRFVASNDLATATLDPRTILITDDVPNDIDLVGGLITEAFQAPLAHVNVLSKGRGTPNMALRNARQDARLTALLGKPVRLQVRAEGFDIREATPAEIDDHWSKILGGGKVLQAKLDTSARKLQSVADLDISDLPRVGAKAAQLAELTQVVSQAPGCPGGMGVPDKAFAIPLVHSIEHTVNSGAQALITQLLTTPALRQNVEKRAQHLLQIRNTILRANVSTPLLRAVEAEIKARFGHERVRMRSSSNTEDLPEFNGAGIYQSTSAALNDPERTVADGLRLVWASLWGARAFAERELAGVDHTTVAMGVLVHEGFLSERVNGVAVSRSVADPNDGDIFFVNSQFGEASVTNPAPGIGTEEVQYRWLRDPPLFYQSRSTFSPNAPVMQLPEIEQLVCRLKVITDHFRPLLDPEHKQPWFAMEVEFKLMATATGGKRLVIKQARPYSFGRADIPADCRERL